MPLLRALTGPVLLLSCLGLVSVTEPASSLASRAPDHPYLLQDTLDYTVRLGNTLIFTLPTIANAGGPVRFHGLALPPHSWLLDGTFFWRTQRASAGDYALHIQRSIDATPVDTLVVRVQISE